MKLAQYLARLTAKEREAIINRRLGPEGAGADDRQILFVLTNPSSIVEALSSINVAQHVLLRWLSPRPDYRASLGELDEALGERLTPELRDLYLRDLKSWGLADCQLGRSNGYVATFPEVVQTLPRARQVSLRAYLTTINSDILLKMCNALGLRNPPTRKEGRIDTIEATLTGPGAVQALLSTLSNEAQALFARVRDQGGSAGAQQMAAHGPPSRSYYGSSYGSMGSWWNPRARDEQIDPLTELVRMGLLVPYSEYYSSWYAPSAFVIADEVEAAYGGRTVFDTVPMQPPPLERAVSAEGVTPSPTALLRDVGHLLGFIASGACEWRQDGEPYKRSLVAFGKLLGQKDVAHVERLWTLVDGANLVHRDSNNAGGAVSVGTVATSPPELLGLLLLGWTGLPQLTAGSSYLAPEEVEARVRHLHFLSNMPNDTWILKSSVEAWMRFTWPTTFMPGFQFGATESATPDWSMLSNVVVAAGKTPEGADALMLTEGNRGALKTDRPDAPTLPPWEESWIVQPDRTIVAVPNLHPDALRSLWMVAQLESNQGASVFKVTPSSISGALNRNYTPDQIRDMLKVGSRTPLPPTVERLIEDQGKRYGRIKVGTAYTFVQTDDPDLLQEIRRNKKLAKLVWRDVAPGVAFVTSDDPDSVLKALRGAGYLPVLDSPASTVSVPARTSGPVPAESFASLKSVVREAVRDEVTLVIRWVGQRGKVVESEVEAVDLHDATLHAYDLKKDEDVMIPLAAIQEVRQGASLHDDDDDGDDDGSLAILSAFRGLLR